MPQKPDRVVSESLGGGESVSMLKKAMKRIFKPTDDKIERMLREVTSIQACRDAALTGDRDLQLLAVCRLGEFGADALDSLDIALDDENPLVRTAAAGMLAYTKRSDATPILKKHASDNDSTVKEAIGFALEWLMKHGKEARKRKPAATSRENPTELLFDTDTIPLRTTDDVLVVNQYTTTSETLEYGVTIKNEMDTPISDITVKILAYPQESLDPVDPLSQTIESIEQGQSGSLIFGFSIHGECIEGEIITSVHLLDSKGEDLSAKAGNVFVRSLFGQFIPLETTSDEFVRMKPKMKQWNREHTILADSTALFEFMQPILESKNLYVFESDVLEKEGVFMGFQAGLAKGRFSGTRIAVTTTIVGKKQDNLSKVRIDIFADDGEMLQAAASDLFETIQRDLGVLEDD